MKTRQNMGISEPGRSAQQGQTLLLVAVSLSGVLVVAALAIDLTTLYVARSEIQHAADAAALAGAKAFVDSGVTTYPLNTALQGLAQTMAQDFVTAVAGQNKVAGSPAQLANGSPTINFTLPQTKGNPRITVTLQKTNLPLFFARIWGNSTASVSATAIAEAYNPAYSQPNTGTFIPTAPKCVKPFLVPNNDPNQGGATFVDTTTGAVSASPEPFIGEQITLTSACTPGSACALPPPTPGPPPVFPPSAGQYLPLVLPASHQYCPQCSGGTTDFEKSTECCDGDPFDFPQCGVSATPATWDQLTNPGGSNGPATEGLQCLIHAASTGPNQGQDKLIFSASSSNRGQPLIQAGDVSHSRYGVPIGTFIGTSDSVITVPLFNHDPSRPMTPTVTIVGFLQLFVNYVGPTGDVNAYILNVSGCGNNASGPVVSGGGVSPIPVRLIHN
jgi:hypothetical protein